MLVDVHCHLVFPQLYRKRNEIIKRAKEAGISAIIECATDVMTNRKVKKLAEEFKIIKPAYGIFPTEAEPMSKQEILSEIEWIKKQDMIAISEIGLEGKNGKDFVKQEWAFRQFLKLAEELKKPAIIHTRLYEKEVINILKEFKVKSVLHCYTGPLKLVDEALKLGCLFSIPPMIVYNTGMQELVKKLPLQHILTETDSPYLGPERGKDNEPANVAVTIKEIAKIKGLTEEEVKQIVFMNYQRLFL